jgi:tetratricopeptide (TPR) repeat protein
MNIPVRRPLFRRQSHSNIYRIFFLALMSLWGIWMIRGVEAGAIQQAGLPTPTPTRSAISLTEEGDALFAAGDLNGAIAAYREATRIDPQNAEVWAKMARIQTYSSALLVDAERLARLQEALISINRAKEVAPDNSTVAAIRAFVLTWNANQYFFTDRERYDRLLTEAEQEVTRALQLDNTNTLALVFYVEILTNQQKLAQAEQYMSQALERGDNLMDLHRVYAFLLESQGLYNRAIQEYDQAISLTPNMTFLMLRAGANYRHLAFSSTIETQRTMLYEKSLEYFARAAKINEQIGIQDPTPYLSISRTYSQMGEYFAASRNVQKALSFDPSKADVYGQLGIVFFKSRNYEGSIPALKCAIRGCTAAESCEARAGCAPGDPGTAVTGLSLSSDTLVYYYTYGSVLAALSRPQDNKCPEAMAIFGEIRASPFGSDPTVLGIIQSGEAICQSVANATPVIRVTATPMPTATATP